MRKRPWLCVVVLALLSIHFTYIFPHIHILKPIIMNTHKCTSLPLEVNIALHSGARNCAVS